MKYDSLFESATVRLTCWYLLILMSISIMFSVVIYNVSVGEVERRLDHYERGIVIDTPGGIYRTKPHIQAQEVSHAKSNMLISLFYINLSILIAGGIGSYALAKRTLRPIERAHHQQTRFVSDASHELRTPLATMTTELEVALRDSNLKKPEMRELLESNLEEVHHLTKLSNVLLKLSTNRQDELPLTTFSFDHTLSRVSTKYDTSDHRINITGDQAISITANEPTIEELLTILIDNAFKYSPEKTPITIAVTAKRELQFSVSNQGDGIAAADLPRVFDRFYRADRSRQRDGYGLGLALARQITTSYRGTISAQSDEHLTTFTVALPIIAKG